MDPQKNWDSLLSAWIARDWNLVSELASALLDWLTKGGFPPEVAYPKELGTECDTAIAKAACSFMHRRAASVLKEPSGIPSDVYFTLSCANCNNEGPNVAKQALDRGWIRIEYFPNACSENFLGICPSCKKAD